MSHHHLKTPVDSATLARLNAGDTVSLSGRVFTCRPLTYDRLLDPAEGGDVRLELERLEAETVFHCGPLVRRKAQAFEMIAMVPMPSWLAGLERIDRAVRSIGLRMIIGKGALDGLPELCRSANCIHLVCAGNYNQYASKVTRVIGCRWPELGLPEAMWIIEVKEFGPFIVDTDMNGTSLYQSIDATFRSEAASLLEELDIDLSFTS
jgi:tartrate/fumarate subfamily iron-sulfur-dependent hydro-lyase beta chain